MSTHITVQDADYSWPDEKVSQPIGVYTASQLKEALVTRTLTDDQHQYIHEQGINWQVDVVNRTCRLDFGAPGSVKPTAGAMEGIYEITN